MLCSALTVPCSVKSSLHVGIPCSLKWVLIFLDFVTSLPFVTASLCAFPDVQVNGFANGAETAEDIFNGANGASSATPVYDSIHRKLMKGLSPVRLEVIDESEQHKGHAGAQQTSSPSGETHFKVTAVSSEFEGLGRVQRHRKVYQVCAM